MTDKELLELAAKAAGFPVRWHESGYYGTTMEIMADESGGPPWNPLTDDGDALRLAVKLRLMVCVRKDGFINAGNTDFLIMAEPEKDLYAATRRAIVRAAAEIGKGMK